MLGHCFLLEDSKWIPAAAAAAAAKSLQSCLTLCEPIGGSPPGPARPRRPWGSPGKNTGVGCHFLLQCMKVKSDSEVAQSCPTPSDPMDCSLPGPSAHGIFQARVLWTPTSLQITVVMESPSFLTSPPVCLAKFSTYLDTG